MKKVASNQTILSTWKQRRSKTETADLNDQDSADWWTLQIQRHKIFHLLEPTALILDLLIWKKNGNGVKGKTRMEKRRREKMRLRSKTETVDLNEQDPVK